MRRLTIRLDVALETEQGNASPSELAEVLAEEIELMLPSVCLASPDVPVEHWPCASVKAVVVALATEQEVQHS